MTDSKIRPERITKPIQLLAAWLAGLLLVNASFLSAAGLIESPDWVRGLLVISSVANVPIFLACLFLLQTKFRPQMQEDSYYSKYLEINTGVLLQDSELKKAIGQLRAEASQANQSYVEMIAQLRMEFSSQYSKVDESEKSRLKPGFDLLATQLSEASRKNVLVQINDLAPHYERIREELLSMRVPLGRSFGSTSINPEVPEILAIGFGSAVPLEILRIVVDVSVKNGFDRIHYSDEDISTNHIYIGSYIYRSDNHPQPVQISEIMETLREPAATFADVIARIAYLQAKN